MLIYLAFAFIIIVVFFALMVFMRTTLAKHLSTATSHLDELNADYTQKLDEAKKRVEEADKYYDETLLKAKTDAEKTRVQVLKEAHEQEQAAVDQSRKQSADILAQANKARDLLLAEVDHLVEERSVERASQIIREILPLEMNQSMHARWVEELLKHGLQNLERLSIPPEVKEARVVSAYALSAAESSSLEKKISAALKHEIGFKHEVDKALIAGLKLVLGSVVIDGSLQFKIKEMTRHAVH